MARQNFSLKIMMVEKKSLFFYKFIFILANETKYNNRVYKKKTFSCDFWVRNSSWTTL